MRRATALVVALLAAGPLLVAPASRAVAEPRALPDAGLNDVVAITASDAWAVGDGGIASQWNGSSWSSRHLGGFFSPNLNGLDAITTADVWTVGGVIVQDQFRGFASHWDGSAWHRTPVPAYPGEMILEDVAAESHADVWAVGRWFSTTPAGRRGGAVIVHWNGTKWRRVAAPTGVASLVAATLLAGGRLLAVGRTSHGAPVAVRATPGAWRVIPLPSPARTRCTARDVDGLPVVVVGSCRSDTVSGNRPYVVDRSRQGIWTLRRVAGQTDLAGVDTRVVTWAVGGLSTTGQPAALRRRADGSWFRVATPHLPSGGHLEAVDAVAFRNAWAVGWRRAGGSQRPLALHWDGASWTAVTVPLA